MSAKKQFATYFEPKVTIDKVEGLAKVLEGLMAPVRDHLAEHVYWNDLKVTPSEYQSRDGFIPYASNCGGFELEFVVPKCEEHNFQFLDFGQCEDCGSEAHGGEMCGYGGQECCSECEGHLNAKLRVWLKFEGQDAGGTLRFYLYAGGGNGDAPYFRTEHEATLFEREFTAKTLAGVRRQGTAAVRALLEVLK